MTSSGDIPLFAEDFHFHLSSQISVSAKSKQILNSLNFYTAYFQFVLTSVTENLEIKGITFNISRILNMYVTNHNTVFCYYRYQ